MSDANAKVTDTGATPTELPAGIYKALPAGDLIAEARSLWGERQEDCAKYGARSPMPDISVPVDVLVGLADALRPFAKYLETADPKGIWSDDSEIGGAIDAHGIRQAIRFGHLRAARDAIAKATGQ
jgi:hypothetical protein